MNSPSQTPPSSDQKRMGLGMIIAAWLVLFVLLVLYFNDKEQQANNPNQSLVTVTEGGKKSITLTLNRFNQYVMTGKINGRDVVFLVDTGATDVAVPEDLAASLSLAKGRAGIAYTANGEARTYATQIDNMDIGDIRLYNIEASIMPGMNNTDAVLLGMSALSHFEILAKDNSLTLNYYAQ